MKVFVGGINTETNTFSPVPTGEDDFWIYRLDEQDMGTLPVECSILSYLGKVTENAGWRYCPSFIAMAEPGGITTRQAYENLRLRLIEDLHKALPVDMVLLPLHGAMVAEGYDDCEGDIISSVRNVVGDGIPIGVELDLHCHLSLVMVEKSDLIAIYREYPHTDILERAADLFRMTADMALGKTRPVMSVYDCQLINVYPTSYEPMRTIVDELKACDQKSGVISADIGHGFPWGDVADCGTKVLVITDDNKELADSTAKEIGLRLYKKRHEVQMKSVSLMDAFDQAESITGQGKPVVIADQSDNAGGGAASDSTFALAEMLKRGLSKAAIGMIWDPVVVAIAMKLEVGARLKIRLGGKTSPCSGDPLDLNVTIRALQKNMTQDFPQDNGEAIPCPCGDSVCFETNGIYIVVNSIRSQVFHPNVFTQLGLQLSELQLIVVKSMFHFHAGFAPIAEKVILMGARGALSTRFSEIPYTKVNTHQFPWLDDPKSGSY